ncbi:MAG TPA: PilZ domain-containing protein [Anaeromyxobacter sp.]|nr:PilZ domain-containing protein [Anaeromyxobacter sp.]
MPDPRRHPRYPVSLAVDLISEAGLQQCQAEDLSAGGCRVVTVFPIPRGSAVRIRLRSPAVAFEIGAPATVAWSTREPPYRAGLQFAEASVPEAGRFLQALLGPVRLENS